MLKDVSEGLGLTIRKAMFLDEQVPADRLLPSFSDLGKLGGQPLNEVFQPSGMSIPLSRTL